HCFGSFESAINSSLAKAAPCARSAAPPTQDISRNLRIYFLRASYCAAPLQKESRGAFLIRLFPAGCRNAGKPVKFPLQALLPPNLAGLSPITAGEQARKAARKGNCGSCIYCRWHGHNRYSIAHASLLASGDWGARKRSAKFMETTSQRGG